MKPHPYPVLYGRQSEFPSTPVLGGFELTNNVQLISERIDRPQQWVITLAPITLHKAVGVTPWANTLDGVVGALPVPPANGNIPNAALGSLPFRVLLSWGAGGVRYQTSFDYPVGGGTFGVLADTLDLNVIDPNSAKTLLADLGLSPVFAASMVPGVPSGPSTMHYLDATTSASIGIGNFAYWSVKPFARHVWLTNDVEANAAIDYQVEFVDGGGQAAWGSFRVQDGRSIPQPLPVPSAAYALKVTNLTAGGAGLIIRPLWVIELS